MKNINSNYSKLRLKKTLIILLTNLLLLVFGLLIIENFFFNDDTNYELLKTTNTRKINLKEHTPSVNFSFKNDFQAYWYKDAILKTNTLMTNKDGFILGNIKDTIQKNTDIYFMGGSSVECLYVDADKRFPYLVQEKISSQIQKDIRTINAGGGGINSYHSLLSFLVKGIKDKPKALVIMHNINDISYLRIFGSFFEGNPERRLIYEPDQKLQKYTGVIGFLRKIKDRHFFLTWKFIRNNILGYNYLNTQKDQDEFFDYRKNDLYSNEHVLDIYRQNLLTIISIAETNNIKPVLMTQFNRVENKSDVFIKDFLVHNSEKDMDNFVKLYTAANEVIREIAEDQNVDLIDLSNLIPRKSEFIFDLVHLTDKGSVLVSDIITDYFLKNNKELFNE